MSGREMPTGGGRAPDSQDRNFSVAAPSISLPKGGGAIRGMGEKFAANPVTGTGSMSVPLATSPGRSGFGPQLSLSYDSGAGNGPFGLGWNLGLPSITRKTDKGLPRYFDAEESDVFILSGAEDLVPVLVEQGGKWTSEELPERVLESDAYAIRRYRPRTEGLFARIERWTRKSDGDIFWRSISRDNITTYYGKSGKSRIADPDDPTRIFSWLICESYDDKGNAIVYEYVEENSDNVDRSQANETNHGAKNWSTNRHLKRIKYGNKTSRLVEPDLAKLEWHFQVVFDYGEGHYRNVSAEEADPYYVEAAADPAQPVAWPVRHDPFSTYRSGFEVRTYRLCRRVLMFHDFESLGKTPCLVRSTEFLYDEGPVASFITAVSHSGYVRQPEANSELANRYLKKSLPPVKFTYSRVPTPEELAQLPVVDIDPTSLENLPIGLDGQHYQWVDLDGEGVSGILAEQQGSWYYKENLGNGSFGPVKPVAEIPSLGESSGNHQLLDLAGDGQLDVVLFDSPTPGFYERTLDSSWEAFRSFASLPNIAWGDPNLKFIDLTGDGHADLFISENEAFVWHASLAEDGFGPAQRVAKALDEERGPKLVFADATQSIFLSDMSGDGLADLVRIRNGEVCYWPNLGYGRFGAKVTMDNAPWFDNPDQFDHKRIRLADIDGTGTTDIIYLHRDGVRLYFNQSGNSWSAPQSLGIFPQVDDLAAITPTDLLGNGTACLVWSSPLPGFTGRQMRYVDLMGGQKPHLLVKTVNNLGAETVVQYAPSTKFYLADKRDGKPWITRLPFPVHVVERVETFDHISRNRFVTRYAFHHGYFDGQEREFRGFGMVEQFDTEELAALTESGDFPDAANIDAASYVPTVLTKTWFHTGAYLEGGRISRHFEDEYYHEGDDSEGISGLTDQQLEAMLVPDTELPTTLNKRQDSSSIPWGLTVDEIQEACRALKGSVLRREIYALDGTDEEDRPYSATEQNYTIELLQPRSDNKHAVFFTHPRESIDFHYERKLVEVAGKKIADPRVTHAMTLEVDGYGNVLKSVAIGYGRRPGLSPLQDDDKNKQEQILITYTENEVTNPVDEADVYRTPLPSQARTYELLRIVPDSNLQDITNLFGFDEIVSKVGQAGDALHDLPYEDTSATGVTTNHPYRRLIEHVRTLYRRNDLAGALPLGQLESLAIPFESYKLAFTPGLLTGVYGAKVTDAMLGDHGGYVHSEGDANWWIPSGKVFFDVDADVANPASTAPQELAEARAHFFLPRKFADPFDQSATVDYDVHDLTMVKTQDPVGNSVTAQNDYRVLQPSLITDPNGNRAEVAFDALGMVSGTAVMGKSTENLGDSLAGFVADLTQSDIDQLFSDPVAPTTANLLGNATTRIVYDLDRFKRLGEPPFAATLARETHVSDPLPPGGLKIQAGFSYSDGFGREIQKKIQAEPGPLVEGGPMVSPRWVGSGWTIFNNKGKPVRQYEPFFDDTHDFKFGVAVGVSPVLFYDPVGRVVATLHPNHTYEKVVFDPWQQMTYDVNDTVTFDPNTDDDVKEFFTRLPDAEYLPTWYGLRTDPAHAAEADLKWPDPKIRDAEKSAAEKAAIHAKTPTIAHFDALGRPFLTLAHNGFQPDGTPIQFPTRVELDIEGNQREVRDAIEQNGDKQGRIVMRYDYDMLGNRIHQASMEAGERWILNDITGKPVRVWDSRGHTIETSYDGLRRPVEMYVSGGDDIPAGERALAEKTVYGESQGSAKNHRGKVYQHYDGAGVVTSVEYDFKGNFKETSRKLVNEYKKQIDWNQPPADEETFTATTQFDALNRPIVLTTPHNAAIIPSEIRPIYNEANLLNEVRVKVRGGAETAYVKNIDYDAKGQRQLIEYGNGASTTYKYDPDTFRLTNLKTTRQSDSAILQDLFYTYDPSGNITRIRDDAQQTLYFRNKRVEPSANYTYDAIYRLIEATGREHLGQVGAAPSPTSYNDKPRVGLLHPGDGNAMGRYLQQYIYDEVGNFLEMIHRGTDPANAGWTRTYAYDENSLIEASKQGNRLSKAPLQSDPPSAARHFEYDAHGNMIRMPHLPLMQWDYRDQLQATAQQVVNNGTPETTWYVYDSTGKRVRKVNELATGQVKDERIYLGGYEIYRRHGVNPLVRETLPIMDDKQRIALVETRTQGSEPGVPTQLIRYQFGNHLGSASVELDDQAQIISYEEYTPYGSTSYQAGRTLAEVSLKRYRYTGKERDEESGLYYHGARYLAPWLGRWTSCDQRGIRDGINVYSYVHNSPAMYTDPTGHGRRPTQQEIKATEIETGNVMANKYGHLGVIDISDPSKSPYQGGPDHPIFLGEGRDNVLLDPEAKLSYQARNVYISNPSSFRTAERTGGAARLEVLDDAIKSGKLQLSPSQYSELVEDIGAGRVWEEVVGFGNVKGISQNLAKRGVIYTPADPDLQRPSSQLGEWNIQIPDDPRTAEQIINETWKDFTEVYLSSLKETQVVQKATWAELRFAITSSAMQLGAGAMKWLGRGSIVYGAHNTALRVVDETVGVPSTITIGSTIDFQTTYWNALIWSTAAGIGDEFLFADPYGGTPMELESWEHNNAGWYQSLVGDYLTRPRGYLLYRRNEG